MDMLIKYIIELLGNILLGSALVYSWNKIYNISSEIRNLKRKNNIISIVLIGICTSLTSNFLTQPIRILVINIIIILINYLFIYRDSKKAIVSTIYSQIIISILEFLFVITVSVIFGSTIYNFLITPIGNFIINLYITFLMFILFRSHIIENISNFIRNIKDNSIIINSIIIVIIMIVTTVESYMKLAYPIVLTTNTMISFIFIFLIFKITKGKKEYEKVNDKYQISITSLKEYETMIDKFRVNNHENKNELLTIRNMIKNKDKKIVEYIDKLVDNKIKDNEKIMYQTSKIPEGGLRATIYSKLCVMDKYKIKYKLDISKDVRTVDLINIDEELILDICKILGVFMDNAIEAAKNIRKKEINIELYVIDDELFIDITNTFKGDIDLTKIGHERHTTKGENHGYGLLLVNKIIKEKSKYLENEKSINGKYFTQTLKIKIKQKLYN